MLRRTTTPFSAPSSEAHSESGNALLTALLLLTLVASAATAFLGVAVQASESTTQRGDRFEARRAGSSVNKLVAERIWAGYRAVTPDDSTTLPSLRAYLTTSGYPNQNAAPSPVRRDALAGLALATNDAGDDVFGDITIESVMAHREDEPRRSRIVVTTIATARRGVAGSTSDVTEAVTDVFSIEPDRWSGLDFALLANNINCIMCHTDVDDARRVYGTNEGFGRARVGSIESFQFRDDPDSVIAGTLYLGGPAIDEHGAPIGDWSGFNLKGAQLDAEGRLIEDGFGDLSLLDLVPADNSTPTPYENLYTNYFDLTEPVDGALPTSFPMPFRDDGGFDLATGTATPAGAGNRMVDDNEFLATTAAYQGSIRGGSIGVVDPGDRIDTFGQAQSLADGNRTGLAPVTAGNVILTGTESDPIYIDGDVAIDGDLILSGPIEGAGSLWVRGNIYIRGDLEYADGTANSSRTFGSAASGAPNALGITSGGNIVIGDPYRPLWGEGDPVDGTQGGGWNFSLEEAASFNRREWLKTQPELPGEPIQVAVGTETRTRELKYSVDETRDVPIYEWRDTGATRQVPVYEDVQVGTREEPVYEWQNQSNGRSGEYETTTRVRVQTGTRTVPVYEQRQTGTREEAVSERVQIGTEEQTFRTMASYDPPRFDTWEETIFETQTPMYPNPEFKGAGFVPRYYAFGEGDPVPVQNKNGYFDPVTKLWVTEEITFGWDETKITLADPNDPTDPLLFPSGGPVAAIETLEPKSDWMDSDVLRLLIEESLDARDADEPFKVDATLYSANSIFGIVPNSPTDGTTGRLRVQGSVLAADVGLLGPDGTEILYDPRGQQMLDIRDDATLGLKLLGAVPAPRP